MGLNSFIVIVGKIKDFSYGAHVFFSFAANQETVVGRKSVDRPN